MAQAIPVVARGGAVLAIFLAASCAGGTVATDCSVTDWSALGFQDGAGGAKAKAYGRRIDDCGSTAPDFAAYETGREQGLAAYCTSEGGFAAGRSGEKYQDICAADKEPAFLEGFDQGARLHALRTAHEKSIDDYDAALADLDQQQYLLAVAEKRYAKPSISNEDREHERQEVEHRRREIIRLERALPQMLYGIEAARNTLDAYETKLKEAGRTPG